MSKPFGDVRVIEEYIFRNFAMKSLRNACQSMRTHGIFV